MEISADKFDAVLFDMDGVVTKTAVVHQAAWKEAFDDFLKSKEGDKFVPFTEDDYLKYVDGKKREDGVRSFLQSRKINLPDGSPHDKPGFESVYALGNLKNKKFLQLLRSGGIESYESTVGLISELKEQGVKIGIVTASKNGAEILKVTNLAHIFDVKVDGIVADRMKLKGKPSPDTYLAAAEKLGVTPNRAVVVEDAASGVQAGQNGHFGLVIGVARSNNVGLLRDHGADVVVHDLAEVRVSGQGKSRGTAWSDLEVTNRNWVLTYDDFVAASEGEREAICAVGNGYFCTRAAAPEAVADGVHYPATYLSGGYNRIRITEGGSGFEQEELVNMPNWLFFTFKIEDGEWFDLSKVEILNYQQQLDLRCGVVRRSVKFRDSQGRVSTYSQCWFVHMKRFHIAGFEANLEPEGWSGTVTFRSALDGRVINKGTQTDSQVDNKHLNLLDASVNNGVLFLKMITKQSEVVVCQAARHHAFTTIPAASIIRNDVVDGAFVAQDFSMDVKEGHSVGIHKTVTLYTSRDHGISEAGLSARKQVKHAPEFHALLRDQEEAWGQLWQQFDLFIETTEEHPKMQPSLLLHLNSFHVLQTASPNIVDLDCGVPPRGWTGEGYEGHIFWDDLFVFPFINLRLPSIAQALLKYRYRRLDSARLLARKLGAEGARFPWQSGSSGREETPRELWIPAKKIWIPDYSHLEMHVNAAIAYNIWQYYQVTANLEFMLSYGAEMLFEIARFFASYATYNKERDRYEIKGVVGPDEYHTKNPDSDEPGINNNAYTNVMAAWTLCRALEFLKAMPSDHRTKICAELQIDEEEKKLWEDVSRKMFVSISDDGIIEQFEGYHKLKEFPVRDGRLDSDALKKVLFETNDTPNQYMITKQADVLMLFYVLSAEELADLFEHLGHKFYPECFRKNIEYYVPKTVNMSTLSRVAHAWVLSRLNRPGSWTLFNKASDQAAWSPSKEPDNVGRSWDMLMQALSSDFSDVSRGTTREGVHMGAMAGTIDIIQRCYTGIVTAGDVIWLSPQLPEALIQLSFNLNYRDQSLAFEISQKQVKVTAHHSSAQPINVGFKGKVHKLNAGASLTFKLVPSKTGNLVNRLLRKRTA